MGVFRTVFADMECERCKRPSRQDIQFKTGDDYRMESYDEGDAAGGLAEGAVFEGCFDGLCRECMLVAAVAQNAAKFESMVTLMEQGRVFVTAKEDGARISVDEVKVEMAKPQTDPFNLNANRFKFSQEFRRTDEQGDKCDVAALVHEVTWNAAVSAVEEMGLSFARLWLDVDVVIRNGCVVVVRETIRPAT